jgi:TPR repeat protein
MQAAKMYYLAARMGHPEAQFNISVYFERGIGVAKDKSEAARWRTMAAAQGVRGPAIDQILNDDPEDADSDDADWEDVDSEDTDSDEV